MSVKIQGGLGNQMFIAAYALSKGCRTFDISNYDTDKLRHYALDQYDLDVELVRDPGAEQGYFQDEKFFDKEIARDLFEVPKGQPNAQCLDVANRILDAKDSCFIGVRRADYLWPERINYHGVLGLGYYFDAIHRMKFKHNMDGSTFFVFTDDIPWTTENIPYPIVDVNGPKEKAWDIWLMSLCKHAIIANSSFHWWGCFLGADKNGGTIVAPKRWFSDEKVNTECSIVPDRWVRI